MKPISRHAAALATVAAIFVGLVVADGGSVAGADANATASRTAAAARKPIIKKRRIAPGLTFTRITDKKLPRRTYVLRMSPSKPVTLDVALATASLPSRRTVQEIAKANDALAAINGDFTNRDIGRPTHPFSEDGRLLQTSIQQGPLFALSEDERRHYLGKPDLHISLSEQNGTGSWRIARWNQGPPAPGEIAGYSDLGGSLETPPAFACSVRLLPTGPTRLDADGMSVVSDYTVDTSACTEASMARAGGIVISAPPATDEAKELLAMTPGTPMRLHWTIGWEGVLDVVGGMPILVQDGRVVASTCSSAFCRPNPRTGIGYTAHGGVLLVVVDGRRNNWSRGVTLVEFAQIMKDLGAVDALNLDGGGSTTMVVQGQVVNKPSDGFQRSISNAVLVLPGADPGEA
jgi:large repetitive protein